MTVSVVKNHIYVTLSAKNLQHLQRMLDSGAGSSLCRQDGAAVVYVSVEPDAVHYKYRDAGPGYPAGETAA